MILRSKLPQAEEFQEWVTADVLPSIRKYGAYIQGLGQIKDFDDFIKKVVDHHNLYAYEDGFKEGYSQALLDLEKKCREIQPKC